MRDSTYPLIFKSFSKRKKSSSSSGAGGAAPCNFSVVIFRFWMRHINRWFSVFDRSLKCVLSTVPPTPTARRAWKLEILTADGARWRKGEKQLWTLYLTLATVCNVWDFFFGRWLPSWVGQKGLKLKKEGEARTFRFQTFTQGTNKPSLACLNDVIRCWQALPMDSCWLVGLNPPVPKSPRFRKS